MPAHRRTIVLTLSLLLAGCLLAGPAPVRAELVGISRESLFPSPVSLWNVDPDSAEVTLRTPTEFSSSGQITSFGSGALLTVEHSSGRLTTLDADTGAVLGSVDITLSDDATLISGGLAWSPVSGLMLLNLVSSPVTGSGSVLYRLDPLTGMGERVALFSVGIAFGLTFGADGRLYTWNRDDGLLIVDPLTSQPTAVAPGSGGATMMLVLAGLPDGSIVGAAQSSPGHGGPTELYRIDPSDGSTLHVGTMAAPGFAAINGLAWVPEPATVSLCAVALFALLLRARTAEF